MSFKGFINTNRLRFFFITILSILSGTSGILAGYIQMYWLTYIKENNWTEVAITTGLMALCWFFAQSVIYFVQYLNNIQEEEYFKKLRDQIAKHYFEDKKLIMNNGDAIPVSRRKEKEIRTLFAHICISGGL